MTILEHLINKYGKIKVDGFLSFILMQDTVKYNAFLQWISITEFIDNDVSQYKLKIISKLNDLFPNDAAAPDFASLLSLFDSSIKKYNTVITYGTYDLFHYGHLQLLKRIKEYCSNLIVAVSTDEFNKLKGKTCVIPYVQRAAIVNSIKFVNKVIPENTWEQKIDDIKKYKVDAFIIGNDWEGKFDYLKEFCDVIYLPRTKDISTTKLKEKLK